MAQETSKNFEVLRQKETDDSVKQLKHRIWTVITEKVNAVNRSASRREPLQLKRKWIEARSRVRHKLLASQRRRHELTAAAAAANTAATPPPSAGGLHFLGGRLEGANGGPPANSNPLELSYFEKLLTLNMCEEMNDDEASGRRSEAASNHSERRPPSRTPRCVVLCPFLSLSPCPSRDRSFRWQKGRV